MGDLTMNEYTTIDQPNYRNLDFYTGYLQINYSFKEKEHTLIIYYDFRYFMNDRSARVLNNLITAHMRRHGAANLRYINFKIKEFIRVSDEEMRKRNDNR